MQNRTKCKAKARTTGNQCNNVPMQGQDICRMHGGSAPQNKAAAQRRLAAVAIQADAEATIAHLGMEPVEDPLAELSKLASSAQAMMHSLGARVNELNDVETFDAKQTPQLRVVVELYERAMDRTHRLLDSLVKHGYAERQVALAESEALLVAGVIRRVLSGLGLTKAQVDQAQVLLAEEFRALEVRQ
jgi:hypothetical protein